MLTFRRNYYNNEVNKFDVDSKKLAKKLKKLFKLRKSKSQELFKF